jgi:hypothetical protein
MTAKENTIATPKYYMLIDREHRIIMDWSAKAGCTVAVKMFFRYMGLLNEALEYSPWVHEYRRDVFYETHSVERHDLDDPSYFKFKVVRNPYDRATSIYLHAMRYDMIQGSPDWSFRQFVIALGLSGQLDDIHFAPQVQHYELKRPGLFNAIVKLESFADDIAEVNRQSGASFSLEGLLHSPHHIPRVGDCRECVADVPWSALKERPIPIWIAFYTDDLKRAVVGQFENDFRLYRYPVD